MTSQEILHWFSQNHFLFIINIISKNIVFIFYSTTHYMLLCHCCLLLTLAYASMLWGEQTGITRHTILICMFNVVIWGWWQYLLNWIIIVASWWIGRCNKTWSWSWTDDMHDSQLWFVDTNVNVMKEAKLQPHHFQAPSADSRLHSTSFHLQISSCLSFPCCPTFEKSFIHYYKGPSTKISICQFKWAPEENTQG